jgi:hypothetical protein
MGAVFRDGGLMGDFSGVIVCFRKTGGIIYSSKGNSSSNIVKKSLCAILPKLVGI